MVVSLLDEVRDAEFGDKRLNKRVAKVIDELGSNPSLSIPGAYQSPGGDGGCLSVFRQR